MSFHGLIASCFFPPLNNILPYPPLSFIFFFCKWGAEPQRGGVPGSKASLESNFVFFPASQLLQGASMPGIVLGPKASFITFHHSFLWPQAGGGRVWTSTGSDPLPGGVRDRPADTHHPGSLEGLVGDRLQFPPPGELRTGSAGARCVLTYPATALGPGAGLGA